MYGKLSRVLYILDMFCIVFYISVYISVYIYYTYLQYIVPSIARASKIK